jgi:hypothetical protein
MELDEHGHNMHEALNKPESLLTIGVRLYEIDDIVRCHDLKVFGSQLLMQFHDGVPCNIVFDVMDLPPSMFCVMDSLHGVEFT